MHDALCHVREKPGDISLKKEENSGKLSLQVNIGQSP